MTLPTTPGSWTLVTFTDSDTVVGELAALHSRFGGIRCVAVVPAPLAAPPGVAVVVDQDGALAASLGVTASRTFILDGRGTVTHAWSGLPETEAVAVFSARSPLPSGAPAWLFPVLAAGVLVAGIGAWAWSRAPEAPVVAAPPVAAAPPVEAAATEVAPPAAGEAAAPGADDEAAMAPEADGPAAPAPGGKKGGRKNVFGEWTVAPRPRAAEIASLQGNMLVLKALADGPVTACTEPKPLAGGATISAEWKLDGVAAKGAKFMARQVDSAGKGIKDPAARVALGRGGGTAGWAPVSATLAPVAGAADYVVCVDIVAGAGSVSVRNLK